MASHEDGPALTRSGGSLDPSAPASKRESVVSMGRALPGRLTATSSRPPSLSVPDYTHISTHEGVFSLYPRPSRASSIISTRTKTSITTVQDDRDGFDIRISQDAVYRIGLDGRILYVNSTKSRMSGPSDGSSWDDGEEARAEPRTSNLFLSSSAAEVDDHDTDNSVSRNPSFKPGKENLTVTKRRSSSYPVATSTTSPPRGSTGTDPQQLRRRGGVKLKLVTRHSSGQVPTNGQPKTPVSATSYQTAASRHSQPSSPDDHIEPVSPKDIGTSQSDQLPLTVDDMGFAFGRWPEAGSAEFPVSLLGENTSSKQPVLRGSEASPRPVLHIDTRDHTTDRRPNPPVVAESPVGIDDGQTAVHFPQLAAHLDIHAHYNKLMRNIDINHERRIRKKEEELGRARDMLEGLARQAVDLKAELIRTKQQVAAMSDPVHIQKLAREQSAEAQSFSFPPLKLSHVRTLKMALKRRAEKMRKSIDDDLGWRVKISPSTSDDNVGEVADEAKTTPDSENMLPASNDVAPASGVEQVLEENEDKNVMQSLLAAKRRIRSVETEQQILEAQVVNLRHALSHWMDRCQQLEKQAMQAHSPIVSESEVTVATMQAKHEVEQIWQARWRDRTEQLNQRMGRIDAEAQKALRQAVAEKDACEAKWRRKCEMLLANIKDKDDEIKCLKGGSFSPGSGFLQAVDQPSGASDLPISPRTEV